ncbi:Zn-dependent amino-or carboxypeptidase, M28 family [Lentibacillus halodurans]|uniref:Zn-dependent amino-or carboxypeptidase, M28 family n=1 Tax=Lentibacillus halodurans TaxID=237679 RepID=A0A1I0X121_9BACI|nr:M28 family peptidase [Lentibacillus halodurans]SFA94712.1 Zn-dependent amino-or carboxypeptidase, M28 family [Lentibacillus halodurans]
MRKLIATIAVFVLLFSIMQTGTAAALPNKGGNGSGFDKKITERFNSDLAMEHISHLSEDIGPRVAGTEEELVAAEYIQQELQAYGYETETETFGIADRLEGDLTTSLNEEELALRIATGSASTQGENVTGKIVDAGVGLPDDFPDETEGNIALIERGEMSFWEKTENAINAGAAGVIIYDNAEDLVPPTPSLGDNESSIPVVAITMEDGQKLMEEIANEEVRTTLSITEISDQQSQNIVAVKEPKGKPVNDDDIVYVTAHYDSVPYSPGASDNASGTSVALELARIMEPFPTDKEVRFVFFGAEEIGLVGSSEYVSGLSAQDVDNSLAAFNMDMVGTGWDQASALYVNVTDGAPNTVWQAAEAAGERLENDSLILYERGASDHVSFYEAGIDAANFILRDPETASLEPWYHTPFDTIDKISPERIQTNGELIGAAVYDTVRQDVPRGKPKSTKNTPAPDASDYLLNEEPVLTE